MLYTIFSNYYYLVLQWASLIKILEQFSIELLRCISDACDRDITFVQQNVTDNKKHLA